MLHIDTPELQRLLLQGNFGLEKEGLRVDGDGFMAHTAHPFPGDRHIVRDFCENQTEINTPVCSGYHEAVESLAAYTRQIHRTLASMSPGEYLWPFSNPCYIRNETDIPVAQFGGPESSKTAYRDYLSHKYGRYKMTLSGIHVNYSFNETLLREDFRRSDFDSFKDYKNELYLRLARRLVAYGWILVAVTAASPLLDSSYVEKESFDRDIFQGLASVRCSELGYWNSFAPILDYTGIAAYADSIRSYVRRGWRQAPTELYYPIRLKPAGLNRLETLEANGVDHIELRMFDLNPLTPAGVEEKDVAFAELLIGWLAASPDQGVSDRDQVQAIRNYKNAAHYDLKTVSLLTPDNQFFSVAHAARNTIGFLKDFYHDYPAEVQEILTFEDDKFIDGENRYAWQIRKNFSGGYAKKGMELARKRRKEALHV
ncbi:MAG: hypothetical protein LIO86_07460 [Lachnospiraceae bacterium]|nr:hypothetical protein [Lachnospiraceae bacterium]